MENKAYAPVKGLPAWHAQLHDELNGMADALTAKLTGWQGAELVIRPEEKGWRGEGKATEAIQQAVDEVSAQGGGTVLLDGGDYVTGSVVLRDNVRLMVAKGSRMLASTDIADFPEHICRRVTVQDTHMGMNQSLIFAEDCCNISICGEGEIDGRGTQDNFHGDETQHGTPGRPFLIRIVDCKGVHVKDVTLRNAACWMENYFNCDEVLIENITVRNQSNYNNDGIDIDGCRDVIIRGCDVLSGDDALCFKAASEMPTERVLVENCSLYSACNAVKVGTDTQADFRKVLVRNCRIGGLEEDPSGLKHPCSDSGISLEMVDGAVLEDFLLTGIDIRRAWSPIFMRMEDRGRVRPDAPRPPMGTLRRVVIEHVTGCENGPRGSYLFGAPERSIQDVILYDVCVEQLASVKPVITDADIGELKGVYPDAHMIDDLGDAPAWGLWLRYVDGLTLMDYRVKPVGEDPRPEYEFGAGVRVSVIR
ncbi:MAG: hypothetical protein IJ507_00920 [Clostridia bacterium]|nr:hypothetical protein [Clostridia bacterium]